MYDDISGTSVLRSLLVEEAGVDFFRPRCCRSVCISGMLSPGFAAAVEVVVVS